MRNTEQPQMAQYNWRTSGAVSIMTKEKTNMNNTKNMLTGKAMYTHRMRVYDDDGNFIREGRTVDPSMDDYDRAVSIGDRMERRYGGTHLRWYKGNKLVAVYLSEFGTVYGPESIAKGDYPSVNYIGGK